MVVSHWAFTLIRYYAIFFLCSLIAVLFQLNWIDTVKYGRYIVIKYGALIIRNETPKYISENINLVTATREL